MTTEIRQKKGQIRRPSQYYCHRKMIVSRNLCHTFNTITDTIFIGTPKIMQCFISRVYPQSITSLNVHYILERKRGVSRQMNFCFALSFTDTDKNEPTPPSPPPQSFFVALIRMGAEEGGQSYVQKLRILLILKNVFVKMCP